MLEKAIDRLKEEDTPILHSDQGWHYRMDKYHKTWKKIISFKVCHVKGIV